MTEKDLRKIWIMLGRYYPQSHKIRDSAEFRAYLRILEPYRPEDVYDACVQYIRDGQSHFPDVDDLTSRLKDASPPSPDKQSSGCGREKDELMRMAYELADIADIEIPEGLTMRQTVQYVAREARRCRSR